MVRSVHFPERSAQSYATEIRARLDWRTTVWEPLIGELRAVGFCWETWLLEHRPVTGDYGELARVQRAASQRLCRDCRGSSCAPRAGGTVLCPAGATHNALTPVSTSGYDSSLAHSKKAVFSPATVLSPSVGLRSAASPNEATVVCRHNTLSNRNENHERAKGVWLCSSNLWIV